MTRTRTADLLLGAACLVVVVAGLRVASVVLLLAYVLGLALFLALVVSVARPVLVEALSSFDQGSRSYLGVSAVFGLIVAVVDTAMLWALGVPGAFVGVVPPALIGLLEGGPSLMVWVVVVWVVVVWVVVLCPAANLVIQSVLQPRYVGSVVGLSTTPAFLSRVSWSWVLGRLGALLAVPMSPLVRAGLVDADQEGSWKLSVISGTPPDETTDPAP